MAKSVQDQIAAILNDFIDDEREKIEKITKEVAEDVVKQLKSTSPKSTNAGKHYASGWKVQNDKVAGRTITSVVYQKNKPQLTHLLAKAHDIKNQYGEYGRSTPDPHLQDAEEWGNKLYLSRLEKEL